MQLCPAPNALLPLSGSMAGARDDRAAEPFNGTDKPLACPQGRTGHRPAAGHPGDGARKEIPVLCRGNFWPAVNVP
jgi:hypothetical protein